MATVSIKSSQYLEIEKDFSTSRKPAVSAEMSRSAKQISRRREFIQIKTAIHFIVLFARPDRILIEFTMRVVVFFFSSKHTYTC